MYTVLLYSSKGKCYYDKWIDSLPVKHQARVEARIFRFEQGNLGDHKQIAANLYEARFMFPPGYRLYFGIDSRNVVVLNGGRKDTQKKDIKVAQALWNEYLEGKNE